MSNKAIKLVFVFGIFVFLSFGIIGGIEGQSMAVAMSNPINIEAESDKNWNVDDSHILQQVIGLGFSMISGFEPKDNINMKEFILTAFLPWDYKGTEDSDLIFNYAAGDESAYFWNKNSVDNPVVAIYSTHSAESYVPYSGRESVSGSRGGIYVASSVVAETLSGKGIPTLVSDTIHDYPEWSKSYSNSLATASSMLANNPSIKMIIDMHRDGGVAKSDTTAEINGRSAAKIMFVVGSDQRYEHPNWRQNLAFAETIGDKMEEMYPGLLRTVKVQTGRYNQHISTHSILVEMGATENTIEEVEYSAVLLANVLEAVLADME